MATSGVHNIRMVRDRGRNLFQVRFIK